MNRTVATQDSKKRRLEPGPKTLSAPAGRSRHCMQALFILILSLPRALSSPPLSPSFSTNFSPLLAPHLFFFLFHMKHTPFCVHKAHVCSWPLGRQGSPVWFFFWWGAVQVQMGERVIDENTTPRVLGCHTTLMSTYCFSSSKSLETGKLVWVFFFSKIQKPKEIS